MGTVRRSATYSTPTVYPGLLRAIRQAMDAASANHVQLRMGCFVEDFASYVGTKVQRLAAT